MTYTRERLGDLLLHIGKVFLDGFPTVRGHLPDQRLSHVILGQRPGHLLMEGEFPRPFGGSAQSGNAAPITDPQTVVTVPLTSQLGAAATPYHPPVDIPELADSLLYPEQPTNLFLYVATTGQDELAIKMSLNLLVNLDHSTSVLQLVETGDLGHNRTIPVDSVAFYNGVDSGQW